ncbi:MAG TPA: hypothetical protein VFG23_03215 [Polyangia bacterium]|nr:hypothetical protein [Polyangia bacterium]
MNRSNVNVGLVFATMLVLGAGCATTVALQASSRTPAAAGSVKISKDGQGNVKLDVSVDYLPNPFELDRSLTTFVVWSIADDGSRVRNMGQLQIDSRRHGSVNLLTPLSNFKLLITAEESGTVEKPSPYVILRGNIDLPKS